MQDSFFDWITTSKGGPGSGNFNHAGRPGKVGGSAPMDDSSPKTSETDNNYTTTIVHKRKVYTYPNGQSDYEYDKMFVFDDYQTMKNKLEREET